MHKYNLYTKVPFPDGSLGTITRLIHNVYKKENKSNTLYVVESCGVGLDKIYYNELTIDSLFERFNKDYINRMNQLKRIYN